MSENGGTTVRTKQVGSGTYMDNKSSTTFFTPPQDVPRPEFTPLPTAPCGVTTPAPKSYGVAQSEGLKLGYIQKTVWDLELANIEACDILKKPKHERSEYERSLVKKMKKLQAKLNKQCIQYTKGILDGVCGEYFYEHTMEENCFFMYRPKKVLHVYEE